MEKQVISLDWYSNRRSWQHKENKKLQGAAGQMERSTWERENKISGPGERVRKYRTTSTTGSKTWQQRVERRNQAIARRHGPVEIKQKCLTCGVIYRPETTEHTC